MIRGILNPFSSYYTPVREENILSNAVSFQNSSAPQGEDWSEASHFLGIPKPLSRKISS